MLVLTVTAILHVRPAGVNLTLRATYRDVDGVIELDTRPLQRAEFGIAHMLLPRTLEPLQEIVPF